VAQAGYIIYVTLNVTVVFVVDSLEHPAPPLASACMCGESGANLPGTGNTSSARLVRPTTTFLQQ
jgi:hypothetical protein